MIHFRCFGAESKTTNILGFQANLLAMIIAGITQATSRIGAATGRGLVLFGVFLLACVATPSLAQGVPSASIAVSPAALAEDGTTNFTFTVTLSATSTSATTVNLGFTGSASSLTDYTGAVPSIVVSAGSLTASVIIDPTADNELEGDEDVVVSLLVGSGYVVGSPSVATARILNDEQFFPSFTFSPASGVTTGGTLVTFTGSSLRGISNVTFGGVPGTDIVNISSTQFTVRTPPRFAGPATVAVTNTTGTTIGNDFTFTGLPVATIDAAPRNVAEDGPVNPVVTVRLSDASTTPTTINLSFGGSATSGTDYAGAVASVVIPAGSLTGSVTIDPTADTTFEPDEDVVVSIIPGTGYAAATGLGSSATITIVNDDPDPNAEIFDGSGPPSFSFTPQTGVASGGTVVTFSGVKLTGTRRVTFGGVPGTDIVNISSTQMSVRTPPGVAGTSFPVEVTSAGGKTVGNNYTYSALPNATVSADPAVVLEDGAINPVFTVRLSDALATATTINLTFGGDATSGVDYTGAISSIVIPAGALSATFAIDPTADTEFEPSETVNVSIGAGTTYSRGVGSSASVTISNDDPDPAVTNNNGPPSFSFSPTSGPAAGGTQVTFTGVNLSGTVSVTFGGVAGTNITNISSTSISVLTPARPAGTVANVEVRTGGGRTIGNNFTYLDPLAPSISNVAPLRSSAGINAPVAPIVITGANFTTATSVAFGTVNAASFVVNSPTQITATPAALVAGDLGSDGLAARPVTVVTANGRALSAQQVVFDGTGPSVLSFPADITVPAAAGAASAVVSYVSPSWDDPSGVASTSFTGLASGANFPIGANIVRFRAVDTVGNASMRDLTVTVTDAQAPVFTSVPANISRTTDPGLATAVVTFAAPVATDNSNIVTLSQTSGLASGAARNWGDNQHV